MPSPPNRRKTGRFGRGVRRRDGREEPEREVSTGPLAGLTSQAPSRLSNPGAPPKPAAPRPRPATQRIATHQPGTRRKVASSDANAPVDAEDRADPDRVLVSAAPKDNTRQLMMYGGIGGGVLLLLIIIVAASSSSSPPRRRAPEQPYQPSPSYSTPRRAPAPRPARSNFHRVTGSIMFICANTDLHPDREVVIRQCPSCSATAPFTWNKDADHYSCKRCKGTVGRSQIECPDCKRKPRVTRLKHGP